MERIDITYTPQKVVSGVVAGYGKNDSLRVFLSDLLNSHGRLFVFVDSNLISKSQYVSGLAEELEESGCLLRTVVASEELKTMDTVLELCSWLMEMNAGRDAMLVAIGGGIITDMVGFAASIYKRGVRYISVPTTLLSQVDAGLGGKTGVNFLKYKNMLGAIHQPEYTFISPEFLMTLPRRDLLSGAAEMLKSFIIGDESGEWYSRAVSLLCGYAEVPEDSASKYISDNKHGFAMVIEAAARVKAGVVSRDPFEKGERRVLNLGHTFAHAIESLSQKSPEGSKTVDVTHGEAVAMGTVLAARLAERLSECGQLNGVAEGLAARLQDDMRSCGMQVDCPFPIGMMADAMTKDKKAEGGKVHFVLPLSVGEVIVYDMTVAEACRLLEE